MVRFTLNGQSLELTADQVRHRLDGVRPENVQQYGVRVGPLVYPVKQAFAAATGLTRSKFTTQVARRHLSAVGLEIVSSASRQPVASPTPSDPVRPDADAPPISTEWHTEAQVQAMVVAHLAGEGWQITRVADTGSRERGIDITAARGVETVAIEVKGFPSRGYADLRRAGEEKRAHPSAQATGWYGRAILAAMLTRSRMPGARSVIALPDFSRYRNLFMETAGSLEKCGIEVWWVSQDGDVIPAV